MKDLGLKRQIQFSLAETGCRYLKPGRYLEKIRIITDIEDLGKKVVTLRHRIVGADDGVTLAEGLENSFLGVLPCRGTKAGPTGPSGRWAPGFRIIQ